MLVVIAGLTLLGWIMATVLVRAKGMSHRVVCSSNLKQIGDAMTLFAVSNRGRYPPLLADPTDDTSETWYRVLYRQLSHSKAATADTSMAGTLGLFRCPSDMMPLAQPPDPRPADWVPVTNNTISYGLNYDVRRHADPKLYKSGVALDRYDAGDVDTYGGSGHAVGYDLRAADKRCDTYQAAEIKNRSRFVLVADSAGVADASGNRVPLDQTPTDRYGITSQVIRWQAADTKQHVAARHSGKANALFADNHVELMTAGDDEELDLSGDNAAALPYWTLPADSQ